MLSTVAAVGSKPWTPSSWKLDSSSTQTSGSVPASMCCDSVSSSVGPMLPATATRLPARSTSWPVKAVTVVLPLVPVMASTDGAGASRPARKSASACANRSSSPPTGKPTARAASTTGAMACGASPGER